MSVSTHLLQFKQLYVDTNTLFVKTEKALSEGVLKVKDVDKIIANIDQLITLLPISFPRKMMKSVKEPALIINLNDPEDEPREIVTKQHGVTSYTLPENTTVLYEESVLIVLEDWKFRTWNYAVVYANSEKYKPLMLAQAGKCMALFPEEKDYWPSWEEDMMVLYANQIGWFAFEDEEDTVALEEALLTLERGYQLSDWNRNRYIKDAKVRLLLKLGRPEEAYPIVAEALSRDKDYADFQDLKKDKQYVKWHKAEKQRKEQEHKVWLQAVEEEKAKVTDQFIYPAHPLVVQHAAILNTIKQRMAEIRLEGHYRLQQQQQQQQKKRRGRKRKVVDEFALYPWSTEELSAFETTNGITLPDEYKVYLMEIGSGGTAYFQMDDVPGANHLTAENIDALKKPFPITADKIHDIGIEVKAWVYPHEEEWSDILGGNMEALFGLPDGAEITDGCILLGYSGAANELYLVSNGEFEGEVWVDTLQFGAEARGCFGAASAKRLKFLEFVAESVKARLVGYDKVSENGDWL